MNYCVFCGFALNKGNLCTSCAKLKRKWLKSDEAAQKAACEAIRMMTQEASRLNALFNGCSDLQARTQLLTAGLVRLSAIVGNKEYEYKEQ